MTLSGRTAGALAENWTWIWAPDGAHPPETLWFRRSFRLPAAPVSARLLITADNAFAAYLNENKQPVAQGADWTVVQEFDVTRFLKAGPNLLAVEVRNTIGHGGLLYKLSVQMRNGKSALFYSDARVRVNRRVPPAWNGMAVDDSRWPMAQELAPANGGVWGLLRGAPMPDPTRITRLWDIRAGHPDQDPYTRARKPGERMLLSASVSSVSEMQILAGAGFTLFQSDSDHLSTPETMRGVWNWPVAAAQTVHRLGLDWCYSPHFAFPPPWYRQSVPYTRIQCLEHRQPVSAFSPWDPTWSGFIHRGYEEMAHEFGRNGRLWQKDRLAASALYVGVHGDYGETGLLEGARVNTPGQREDWQRRFGDLHDHTGWWCHDSAARADFRTAMLKKYGGLEPLNAAWGQSYKRPEEITYPLRPRAEARQEWLDFVEWYRAGVARAAELNLSAARKYFPEALLMLPAGFSDEDPRNGNDNSLIARIAAQYQADVRSTHGALKPFAENAATVLGRLGSACRYYNAPFWIEPPSNLSAAQETQRLFEAVSQGAKGIFDWTGAAVANREIYYRYGRFLRVEKPVVDVAMFYPAEAQQLRPEGFAPLFAQACGFLRDVVNYDIVDDRMVRDGCLGRYRILALWEGAMARPETLARIKEWVSDGGVVLAYDFGKVRSFDGDTSWFTEMFGYVQQLTPARLSERYAGKTPARYRIAVGSPESADYLSGDWFEAEMEENVMRRWTGATAAIRVPVDPEKDYTLHLRVVVPEGAADRRRRVLINGRLVGELTSVGDVTYRFLVPASLLAGSPLTTVTIQSETFLLPGATGSQRMVGVQIQSIQMTADDADPALEAVTLPGGIRRELDLRKLNTDWTRTYGKGLTIYFPANRQLLKGYIEVIRRAVYHLSAIQPGRRDALPIDNDLDGVYATLFADKILYYNSKDTPVEKRVVIPPEAFAAWQEEVVTPTETSWTLHLKPHEIGAIYLAPPPQELRFECEEFTHLGELKPIAAADCSPGKGATCVRIARGAAITTRFRVAVPGRYAIYTRCLHNDTPEPVDLLLDDRQVAPIDARAGQTILSGTATLTAGDHSLMLRARPGRDVRADFVIFTNDPTIAGYNFAMRTAPVE